MYIFTGASLVGAWVRLKLTSSKLSNLGLTIFPPLPFFGVWLSFPQDTSDRMSADVLYLYHILYDVKSGISPNVGVSVPCALTDNFFNSGTTIASASFTPVWVSFNAINLYIMNAWNIITNNFESVGCCKICWRYLATT